MDKEKINGTFNIQGNFINTLQTLIIKFIVYSLVWLHNSDLKWNEMTNIFIERCEIDYDMKDTAVRYPKIETLHIINCRNI